MKMRPEQFTMWLRGVMDGYGEGVALPAEVAAKVYAQLSEVVSGQVADRLADAWREQEYALGKGMQWPQPAQVVPYGVSPNSYQTTDTISGGYAAATTTPIDAALQIEQLKSATALEIARMQYENKA